MNREDIQILSLLPLDGYLTSSALAKKMGCSSKTIRNKIKEINNEFLKHSKVQAEIISKPRFGFQLKMKDNIHREQLYAYLNMEIDATVPITQTERVNYLLVYLLTEKDYVTIADLSEKLYISEGVVKTSLKHTEYILNQYDIHILRRPGYGLKIEGKEVQIRDCLVNLLDGKSLNIGAYQDKDIELKRLVNIVWPLFQEKNINISEIAFHNFLLYIYITINRNKFGYQVTFDREQVSIDQSNYQFVIELSGKLAAIYDIKLTDNEIKYLSIHLAGKRVIGNSAKTNLVISKEMNELVDKMLDSVCDGFNLQLKENFDLCMLLKQHMIPLDIRMRYQITLENPIVEDIQKNYPFAYAIAERASIILQEYYGHAVPSSEIGYLAVIFELAIENREHFDKKSNILIVCSTGKGSSNLLMYKYKREFGDYLNEVNICNMLEVKDIDFGKIDYVFTTVPLSIPIPVPVYNVSVFLNEEDIINVRSVLNKGSCQFFKQYFKKELIFTELHADTKEQVIKYLCEESDKVLGLSDSTTDSVLYREALSSTDYGNLVAIPHSYRPVVENTIVILARLDKKIQWGDNLVQVVVLFLIGKKEDPNVQRFYQIVMQLLMNKNIIQEVINEKSFSSFFSNL